MPHYNVKCPNGKWRVYTSIVDGWISGPIDEDELPDLYQKDFQSAISPMIWKAMSNLGYDLFDDDDLAEAFEDEAESLFSSFKECESCDVCSELECIDCMKDYAKAQPGFDDIVQRVKTKEPGEITDEPKYQIRFGPTPVFISSPGFVSPEPVRLTTSDDVEKLVWNLAAGYECGAGPYCHDCDWNGISGGCRMRDAITAAGITL